MARLWAVNGTYKLWIATFETTVDARNYQLWQAGPRDRIESSDSNVVSDGMGGRTVAEACVSTAGGSGGKSRQWEGKSLSSLDRPKKHTNRGRAISPIK